MMSPAPMSKDSKTAHDKQGQWFSSLLLTVLSIRTKRYAASYMFLFSLNTIHSSCIITFPGCLHKPVEKSKDKHISS